MRRPWFIVLLLIATGYPVWAENRIDQLRPDAPELSAYGASAVGVRTLHLIHPGQIDIARLDPKAAKPDPLPRYDRPLTVEIWYPAQAGASGDTVLKAIIRDGKTVAPLRGKAVRDAAPAKDGPAYPLVIISHGFPGNRYLLSPLAENIASKGYVVAAIDHTDTTYDALTDRSFASALVNRSLDQLFVLDQIGKLSGDPAFFLKGRIDADRSAIIGYSMGGYGTLVTAGMGLTKTAASSTDERWSAPFGTLALHESGSQSHLGLFDPRLKTVIVFAPAGWSTGFFDAQSAKGLKVPALFVGGSQDEVVQYESGVRATWQAASGVDRALLTFENAGHNAGAPMPAPQEAYAIDPARGVSSATHYIDAVWDTVRMNNIADHFVTAWLGKYLKGEAAMDAYLDLPPVSNKNSWKGFPDNSARGLRFETLKAGE